MYNKKTCIYSRTIPLTKAPIGTFESVEIEEREKHYIAPSRVGAE